MIRKIIKLFIIVVLCIAATPAFSKGNRDNSSVNNTDAADALENAEPDSRSGIENYWQEFAQDAADAFKSFGNAMSETGKQIGKDIQKSFKINYFGTWEYNGKKATTTIAIHEDGTMEITQAAALDVHYWKGTYITTLSMITFNINKSGNSTGYSRSESETKKTWQLLCAVDSEKSELQVRCSSIPSDADGHDFSNTTIFVKKINRL
ncbi:MAG: hypothetical protein J6I73_04955 [Treponema sp.]|nr:hypothetical protein [Treponema sp.]